MAVPTGGQQVKITATDVDGDPEPEVMLRVEDVPAFVANELHVAALVIEYDDGRRVRYERAGDWS